MSFKNTKHEIFSAVSLCGYPPNVIDSLIELISQILNYRFVKSPPQYKIKTKNQEKFIAVRCPLDIPFNQRNYEVPIIIYFSKFIPLEPPKLFLQVPHDSAINPKCKEVDKESRLITTPSLRSWNQFSNMTKILNEIKNSFSETFPLYKSKHNQNKNNKNNDELNSRQTLNTININNNAIFNFVNNNNINNNTSPKNDPFANIASIFTQNFMNNNNNNEGFNFSNTFQNKNNNNFMNINIQNNKNQNINNYNNYNKNLDPNKIKNILVETVYDKISSKLIGEYKKLSQQNKTLNNYIKQYINESGKMEKYIMKKQEISNECTKNLYNLNNEIKKYNEYINKKKNFKLTEKNCLEFIKVESPKALEAIANEINYEELLIMIKRGFEKKKITLKEAIDSTRNISRELFISRIIREKTLKNIGKI